jgi:hypothetical protein
MTNISVLTPTVREKGLDIVLKGLCRQTIPCGEWLIGSRFDPLISTWVRDDFEGGFWSFGRIMNKMLRQAKGDLIVSIQDYTFFNPEALEKFQFYFEKDPLSIVSGIGDKYDSVYPELGVRTWTDPRRQAGKGFHECPFHYIEGNFCAFPKQAFIDIGGLDESLDFLGLGLDFYSLLDRLNIQGKYKFYLDDTNESFSLMHDRVKDWDEKNITTEQYKEKRKEYLVNPVLNFLA